MNSASTTPTMIYPSSNGLNPARKQRRVASKPRLRRGERKLFIQRCFGISALVAASLFPWATQAATVTWDSGGTSPVTDGTGIWSASSTQWWNGSTAAGWTSGYDAVIGSSNGAAGTITVSGSLAVNSITLNTPGSGNYTITGGTVGVAAGITAITAPRSLPPLTLQGVTLGTLVQGKRSLSPELFQGGVRLLKRAPGR